MDTLQSLFPDVDTLFGVAPEDLVLVLLRLGSYKNPHSHRTVNLTDSREAQEQVMLATHLLGIVDARRQRLTVP